MTGSANLQFDATDEEIIEQAVRLNTTGLIDFYVVLLGGKPDTACVHWSNGVPTVSARFNLASSYKAVNGVLVRES